MFKRHKNKSFIIFYLFVLDRSYLTLTYKQLFEILQSFPEQSNNAKFLKLKLKICKLTGYQDFPNEFRSTCNTFYYKYISKWNKSTRIKERFLEKNKNWLATVVKFKKYIVKGRKTVAFSECSERSKRRKTKPLRENSTPQELTYAAQMSYRSCGNLSASKVLKTISNEPEQAKSFENKQDNLHLELNADEALALIVEANLSKHQYKLIKTQAGQKNCNLYPSYDKVLNAKKMLPQEHCCK